jgi:tRNA (guanosine-2'-O-)-methyltransferase
MQIQQTRSKILNEPQIQRDGLSLEASQWSHYLTGFLTEHRCQRIKEVIESRTTSVIPVLEGIYDRGNISAVMRSAEAFGLYEMHVIELSEKFKVSARVSKGADKWLDVQRSKNTRECLVKLKDRGYKIYATHLDEKSVSIETLDFTQPSALVFGNEKLGVTQDVLDLCDQSVIVPMYGFVQSFNISVAAALSFFHIVQDRKRRQGFHGDLTPHEKKQIQALYYLNSFAQPGKLVNKLINGETILKQDLDEQSEE